MNRQRHRLPQRPISTTHRPAPPPQPPRRKSDDRPTIEQVGAAVTQFARDVTTVMRMRNEALISSPALCAKVMPTLELAGAGLQERGAVLDDTVARIQPGE